VKVKKEVKENLIKKLSVVADWHQAQRDDSKVAKQMYKKKKVDSIYNLEETGLLDEFYDFLEEMDVIKLVKKITPTGVKRVMVPFFQYVLLYMLKILFGIEAINAVRPLLFSNQAAMKLVGFNAHQIKNGVCRRGEWKRKKGSSKKSTPICDDTLARNIVKISPAVIEKFFNGVISCLAKCRVFPKEISVIIDSSDIQTTQNYKGCGSVTRTKTIRDKKGNKHKIEITVYGWKIIVVFWSKLKIPLACKVVKIQESENDYALEVVKQAMKNIEPYSKIIRISEDRGFLDGKDQWWLNQQGIGFVVPAKISMDVYRDAKSYIGHKEEGGIFIKSRTKWVNKRINGKIEKIPLETELLGIEGLNSYWQYGEKGCEKEAYKRHGKINEINAIVVLIWDGKDYTQKKGRVYLTNMPVGDPFVGFDTYDDRSLIENCLYKESKQGWHIKHSPQKTEQAIVVHIFFTLTVFALSNAFHKWKKEKQKEEEEEQIGIIRKRREIALKNKNKVIVFIEGKYGIFYMAEVLILSGVEVKELPEGITSRNKIFRKYNIKETTWPP